MNKTRRALHLLATPVVVIGIYTWLIRQACKDAVHMVQLRRKAR